MKSKGELTGELCNTELDPCMFCSYTYRNLSNEKCARFVSMVAVGTGNPIEVCINVPIGWQLLPSIIYSSNLRTLAAFILFCAMRYLILTVHFISGLPNVIFVFIGISGISILDAAPL